MCLLLRSWMRGEAVVEVGWQSTSRGASTLLRSLSATSRPDPPNAHIHPLHVMSAPSSSHPLAAPATPPPEGAATTETTSPTSFASTSSSASPSPPPSDATRPAAASYAARYHVSVPTPESGDDELESSAGPPHGPSRTPLRQGGGTRSKAAAVGKTKSFGVRSLFGSGSGGEGGGKAEAPKHQHQQQQNQQEDSAAMGGLGLEKNGWGGRVGGEGGGGRADELLLTDLDEMEAVNRGSHDASFSSLRSLLTPRMLPQTSATSLRSTRRSTTSAPNTSKGLRLHP